MNISGTSLNVRLVLESPNRPSIGYCIRDWAFANGMDDGDEPTEYAVHLFIVNGPNQVTFEFGRFFQTFEDAVKDCTNRYKAAYFQGI